MNLQICFWVIFIIAALGSYASGPDRAWLERPARLLLFLLIGILGWQAFGGR